MTKEFMRFVEEKGCVEIDTNCFLQTAEYRIAHERLSKKRKQTIEEHPFWIVSKQKQTAGYDTIQDAMDAIGYLAILSLRSTYSFHNRHQLQDLYCGGLTARMFSCAAVDKAFDNAEQGLTSDEVYELIVECENSEK